MSGAGSLPRIGGHLALDFANTAGWHASDHREEHLTDYGEFLAWARAAGAITAVEAAALEQDQERHPEQANRALGRVIRLRETVYRVFGFMAQGRSPSPEDLDRLHRARVAALSAAELEWKAGRGGRLRWPSHPSELTRPLHPIVISALELIESGDVRRLRQCRNHPCGWLFLDRSRNGTRRWCSSEECGNASRVRRFRARRATGTRRRR